MKTAVCYYSRHHGNTLRVLEAMTAGDGIELIDASARKDVSLEGYDLVGFASGIYFGKFHETVTDLARRCLPEGQQVFFLYTCGSMGKGYTKTIAAAAASRGAAVLGEYGCRGYDTFGPFKLVGGIAKGHPDTAELERARVFFASITSGR